MGNCSGAKNLVYGDFKSLLYDFSDSTIAKVYEKMEYSMWRTLSKTRKSDVTVIVSWDENGIKIHFCGEDEYHFFTWESSFGRFIKEEYISKKWVDYFEHYDLLTGEVTKIPIESITTQSTSSTCYPVKNYKVDIASTALDCGERLRSSAETTLNRLKDTLSSSGIGVCAIPYDSATCISSSVDTKVDKSEFDNFKNYVNEYIDSKNEKENENMNAFKFDFGPVNGNAVRMSMYGLAVKNKAGTFVSYDAKAGEIMDVDVFNFDGANFLYKMPVAMKDIAVGDVVIHHGAPMFVVGKSTDGKGLVVIDVIAGERKEVMLAKSPFGFNFATKVVNFLGNAFNGNVGANADNPFGNMWMLMAMSGDNKDMNEMLPFMMMANGGNIDSNMLMFMAMSGKGSNDMLPMLMMMNMNAPAKAEAHQCQCGGNCGEHHN